MSDMKIFSHKQFGQVRIVDRKDSLWFLAKDVTNTLGYQNSAEAIKTNVDIEDVDKIYIPDLSNNYVIINESGLYSLILKSQKREAKQFKKWVTSEVLPSVREHGVYMTPERIEDILANPDTIIELATKLKEAKQKIQEDKPLVSFANTISASEACIGFKEFADLLDIKGFGRNKLMAWLRDNDFLTSKNEPYRRWIEQGIFETVESIIATGSGTQIRITTKVTGKGQVYLTDKISKALGI